MSDERFLRIIQMVGEEGLQRLQQAYVVVVGLGAVGGYATEALARAGVGRLRLVDFDVIHPSNINRQLYALQSTLGRPKVEVAAERVRDINPACRIEGLREFFHVETADRILQGSPDLVIDAIDSYTPKLELICAALQRGLPLIASMGAALRTDPLAVHVGVLSEVTGCPLARRVRKGLRQRGHEPLVRCVYSEEPVCAGFVHPPEKSEGETLVRGRPRRCLGSLPTMTGIFGLTLANTALQMLLGDLFPGG